MTHDKYTSKDGAPETVKQQRLLQDRSTEGLQDQRAYLMNSASRKRKTVAQSNIKVVHDVDQSKEDMVLVQ